MNGPYERRGNSGERRFVERRRSKDWVSKGISLFAILAWITTLVVFVCVGFAQPPGENFITRVLSLQPSTNPNWRYLEISQYALLVTFLLCLFGLIFNIFRHKRKTDKFNKSIIILGLISLAGFVYITLLLR